MKTDTQGEKDKRGRDKESWRDGQTWTERPRNEQKARQSWRERVTERKGRETERNVTVTFQMKRMTKNTQNKCL